MDTLLLCLPFVIIGGAFAGAVIWQAIKAERQRKQTRL